MVLLSAASFGTTPVLAKLAYASGLDAGQVLAYRFILGAAGLLLTAAVAGQSPRRLGAGRSARLLALGMFLYASMSGTFFFALVRLPASLTELIAYVYPSLVALGAWLFFRRRIGARHGAALLVSFFGLSLLVGGLQARADALAVLFAIASPVLYAAYILAGERLMRASPVILSSALVQTGAALTFTVGLLVVEGFRLPATPAAWAVLALLALVPSMLGISLFLGGLARVGAPQAALLSTFEPIVTVILAATLLGERLSPLQAAGAVTVLAAVVGVQFRQPATVAPLQQ